MSESRKIVLVIGNGFDLDLGLKTSYKDFWESEFCPKDYPSPLIRHLNSQWLTIWMLLDGMISRMRCIPLLSGEIKAILLVKRNYNFFGRVQVTV
ncbi:MAG: hypothetical protein J6X91_02220 [Bacteroidales bacterium]|nr:hypothetical protein [Bacteroidales bacterium]